MAAACTQGPGAIVEIGSFKGKSTIMLAKICQHYGLGSVVAIDPHNFNSQELQIHRSEQTPSTFGEFLSNLRSAGVYDYVDIQKNRSHDVASGWKAPIRFLWIDGDHSYPGAKADFEDFLPHVVPGGIVAFHDALHEFAGPIRVFAEDVLRSNRFGPSGFVGSIAWSQFRPLDGSKFESQRRSLDRLAAPLIPYVSDETSLSGLRKMIFKLKRSRVPRALSTLEEWVARFQVI